MVTAPCELLALEHAVAMASELHPDHWPAWLRDLGERLEAGQAWRDDQTTGLALAVVGRDPCDRGNRRGPAMSPRSRIRFVAEVQRVEPLRTALLVALQGRRQEGAVVS